MLPDLERRELIGTALKLIPGFHILKALPRQKASQTPEEQDNIDRLMNTENWFARHAEHCLNRISWQDPLSDWSDQLHQHLDRFAEAAVGADGGPGMYITGAQMDFLNWQTHASAGTAPCQPHLFVATMFLIDMTVPCRDANEDSSDASFAEALKSKHPSLYEALIAALRRLNIAEVLTLVTQWPEIEDSPLDEHGLLREHLKAIIPMMTENVYSLAQSITPTIAANA